MNNKNKFIRLGAGIASLCLVGVALTSCGIFGNGDGTLSGTPGRDSGATNDSGIAPPAVTTTADTSAVPSTDKPGTTAEVTTEAPAPEHKLEQIDGIWYVDGVLIANKTYPLPRDYAPGGLLDVAEIAFKEMQNAAAKDGIKLTIVSGYRSYTRQENLYNKYVAKDGKAEADRYSARPGYSEHQSGLAMDLNSVEDSFAYTKEAQWIAQNCARFGFIIRYPKGKESITGYIYEPWHVRFLGVELAEAITASGLTFEEYFGITSEYKD